MNKVDINKIMEKYKKYGPTLEREAKTIVYDAFRINPTLDDIHTGKKGNIPKNISRISNKEMKKIMKYAVDMVNFLLWLKENEEDFYKEYIGLNLLMTYHWDRPRNPKDIYQEVIKISGKKK